METRRYLIQKEYEQLQPSFNLKHYPRGRRSVKKRGKIGPEECARNLQQLLQQSYQVQIRP